MKKDPADWRDDDDTFLDRVIVCAMGVFGAAVALLLAFWLLAIFEVLP